MIEFSVCFLISGLVETICDHLQDIGNPSKRELLLRSLTTHIKSGFNVK